MMEDIRKIHGISSQGDDTFLKRLLPPDIILHHIDSYHDPKAPNEYRFQGTFFRKEENGKEYYEHDCPLVLLKTAYMYKTWICKTCFRDSVIFGGHIIWTLWFKNINL